MESSRRNFVRGATALAAAGVAACTRPSNSALPEPTAAEPAAPSPRVEAEATPVASVKPTMLVLGGTGFLGPQIVDAALAAGYEVTLFNRGKTNPHLYPELEKLVGDRDGQLDALEGRNFDVVMDTSGYVPRIVSASAQLLRDHVKRYVFVSSISVYADLSKPRIDEASPVAELTEPGSEDVRAHYGALKALCERAVQDVFGARATIARPGLIVGPGDPTDRFTYWPVRVQRGGEVLAPGTTRDPVQWIDARDLGEWLVHAGQHDIGGVFNTVGSPAPMGHMLETCRTVVQSDATFTWVDADFLAKHDVEPWSDMPVWVPPSGDSLGFAGVSAERAVAAGLRFRPLDQTVEATMAWFVTQPDERKTKLRAGLDAKRETEVLAAWHAKQRGRTSKSKRG